MSFLSLSSAWLFLLLGPLIAFYFLKLKRPRSVVSSLVLWRQVLDDQRVNSPFQRFKRNLLLFLQIALLALLVLAAMQPLLRRKGAAAAGRLPILIDCSASMAALDSPGGISRLEAAKRRVRSLIDALPGDQEISLIAFAKGARRLTGFTNNPRELREALASLEIEDVPGDLEEALRLAQALSRATQFERVLLFSDGNFPAQANFELPFSIDYQRLEPAGANYGITACSARRAPGGQWELFVELSSSPGAASASCQVDLFQDGASAASETVTLVGGGASRLSFKILSDKPTALEVRLSPNGFDSLPADNAAWLALPAPRPLEVFVPADMTAFRHALEALEGLRLYPNENGPPPPALYDLALVRQPADLETPARVLCSVALVPPALQKLVAMEGRNSQVVDWRRDSPLLEHVVLDEVLFMDESQSAPQISENDFAQAGFAILAQGARGPLILEKRDRDSQRFHLLFDPSRSTLPYRVGFPILVSNLVRIARSGLAEAVAARTGVLPALSLEPNGAYAVEGPAGWKAEARADEYGWLDGVAAPRAGRYALRGPGADVLPVLGASLLSPGESGLAGVDQIEFADQLKVVANVSDTIKTERSLWWPLAAVALGVLLVEWWFFQKRPAMVR